MMTFYVIRHGETKANKNKKIMGRKDSPITADGKRNIIKLAKILKKKSISYIYSSDLGRAKSTTKIISEILNNENIKFTNLLRETDYGNLTGKYKKEVSKKHPLYHKDAKFRNPGGESFDNLYNRIKKFISNIEEDDNILIVTHSGCIRAIYSYTTKTKMQANINMKVPHDGIFKFTGKKVELIKK